MIDEYEAYDAYLMMIEETKIVDFFTTSFTLTADDFSLIEKVSRLMMGTQTTDN